MIVLIISNVVKEIWFFVSLIS